MIFNLCKAIKISKKNQLLRTCILCLAFVTMIASGVVGGISVVHNENVKAATKATPKYGSTTAVIGNSSIAKSFLPVPIWPGYVYITPVRTNKFIRLASVINEGNNNPTKVYAGSDRKGKRRSLFEYRKNRST